VRTVSKIALCSIASKKASFLATSPVRGTVSKNDAFLEAIEHSAILETVRTGACGIGRGERILRV